MLNSLSIRDVVLIERLDLHFAGGLTTLTGETGAGKSILLDSLGLALGARADTGLIRSGAEQAVVAAAFSVPHGHPALTFSMSTALIPRAKSCSAASSTATAAPALWSTTSPSASPS